MIKNFSKHISTNLTHINSKGKAVMVNISNKKENLRTAIAKCTINVPDNIYKAVLDNNIKKGDVINLEGNKKEVLIKNAC